MLKRFWEKGTNKETQKRFPITSLSATMNPRAPSRNFTVATAQAKTSFCNRPQLFHLSRNGREVQDLCKQGMQSINKYANIYIAPHHMRENAWVFYTPLSVMEATTQLKQLYSNSKTRTRLRVLTLHSQRRLKSLILWRLKCLRAFRPLQ